jgi:hypothetical protein
MTRRQVGLEGQGKKQNHKVPGRNKHMIMESQYNAVIATN